MFAVTDFVGDAYLSAEPRKSSSIRLVPPINRRTCSLTVFLQLPKKTDEVVFCPLTHDQITVYRRILGTEAVQNMIRKDELCDCGSKEKYVRIEFLSDMASYNNKKDVENAVTHSNKATFSVTCPPSSRFRTIWRWFFLVRLVAPTVYPI